MKIELEQKSWAVFRGDESLRGVKGLAQSGFREMRSQLRRVDGVDLVGGESLASWKGWFRKILHGSA